MKAKAGHCYLLNRTATSGVPPKRVQPPGTVIGHWVRAPLQPGRATGCMAPDVGCFLGRTERNPNPDPARGRSAPRPRPSWRTASCASRTPRTRPLRRSRRASCRAAAPRCCTWPSSCRSSARACPTARSASAPTWSARRAPAPHRQPPARPALNPASRPDSAERFIAHPMARGAARPKPPPIHAEQTGTGTCVNGLAADLGWRRRRAASCLFAVPARPLELLLASA